jgi:hypothetical protein
MKMTWKCLLLICAAAAFPGDGRANDLGNPGFETGDFTSWGQWQGNNMGINNWGHNGSGFSAAAWWQASAWQDAVVTDPTLSYTVGGWIYDDVAANETLQNGVFASIRVEFKNAADSIVGTWTTGNLTGANLADNAWNDLTAVVTPSSFGAGITKATLVWEVNNSGSGSGIGIFDDLVLSCGLLGLGILNWRGKLKRTA